MAPRTTIRMLPRTLVACLLLLSGCGLFEPREPESPSQSSLNYTPPTDPTIVIANLQSAIDQKNVANYISCFADPSRTQRLFTFIPSARYASVLANWTRENEEGYFRNLVARSRVTASSNLFLTLKSSVVTSDSVVYIYDYTLTFEHDEPGPKTTRGDLQFSLAVDPSNFWSIYRWVDLQTVTDTTWSFFKVKFSN